MVLRTADWYGKADRDGFIHRSWMKRGLPDDEFSFWLTREIGVTPVPGSSFYADPADGRHLIRFAFPKTLDMLEEAGARLAGVRERVMPG